MVLKPVCNHTYFNSLIALVVDTELNWSLFLLGVLVSSGNLELYISRQWSLKTCSGGVSRTDEFELHGKGLLFNNKVINGTVCTVLFQCMELLHLENVV